MFRSIRWRLVVSYVQLTLLTVSLVGVLTLSLVERYVEQRVVEELRANAESVARQVVVFRVLHKRVRDDGVWVGARQDDEGALRDCQRVVVLLSERVREVGLRPNERLPLFPLHEPAFGRLPVCPSAFAFAVDENQVVTDRLVRRPFDGFIGVARVGGEASTLRINQELPHVPRRSTSSVRGGCGSGKQPTGRAYLPNAGNLRWSR